MLRFTKEMRKFHIAYCDKNNKPYYDNATILNAVELSTGEIVSSFINDLKEKCYCVYMIVEISPYKNFDEVESLIKANPTEAEKHFNLLYIDTEILKLI